MIPATNWEQIPPTLAGEPDAALEARALTDVAAACECSLRYAGAQRGGTGNPYRGGMKQRIVRAWLSGLHGEYWIHQSNFEAPLRSAHHAGAVLRCSLKGKAGSDGPR